MSIDELRQRLEKLNRGPLKGTVRLATELPDASGRSGQTVGLGISDLVPGMVRSVRDSKYYSIMNTVDGDQSSGIGMAHRLIDAVTRSASNATDKPLHPSLLEVSSAGIDQLLFIDLETCGFSGTPVFLIGAMYCAENRLVTEQLFARDYSEEAAILRCFAEHLTHRRYLVTFNGKSFDWPFLATRAAVARIKLQMPSGHCDLLHPSRRRFRAQLPDCRLQTLEQHICGRRRIGDIPGGEIPAAYHRFVRTQDARQMRDVLRHNYLDLVTMAEVLVELLRN